MIMEGMKGNGGGKVGVGHEDDIGDGMQCSDHPYRNNLGGICAFCLQEKLGKLVSSSVPPPRHGSSSSSSSPSLRSDIAGVGNAYTASSSSSFSLSLKHSAHDNGSDYQHHRECYTRRARIPFLLAKKKKKVPVDRAADIVFKRSMSTTTPRGGLFLGPDDGESFSPRKRAGFWSFFYTSSSSKSPASKKLDKNSRENSASTVVPSVPSATSGSLLKLKEKSLVCSSLGARDVILEVDESPSSEATASASASASASFERKVSRSRSVGCGSRSFSGDFFERISTGFGDCTLRRVESQREGKPKAAAIAVHHSSGITDHSMKERVKCGGIFGGFMMTSSSSSSSSSSYWVSSSAEEISAGKTPTAGGPALVHGRSKSWGWAFASPMRAFGKPSSSKDGKRGPTNQPSNKNATPNLAATPSLLAVRG